MIHLEIGVNGTNKIRTFCIKKQLWPEPFANMQHDRNFPYTHIHHNPQQRAGILNSFRNKNKILRVETQNIQI